MKIIKILLLLIILLGGLTFYKISSIWSVVIKPWKYVVEKKKTPWDLLEVFSINENEIFFKLWLRTKSKINLQAWTFSIGNEVTLEKFINEIANKPDSLDKEIMIRDWLNIYDLDYFLYKNWYIKEWELISLSEDLPESLISKYPFLKWRTLEWFLYPDTYRIPLDSDLNYVVNLLLSEFKTRIYDKYEWDDFYNDLIIASIVHREEKSEANKPIVAWILKKRLKEWIALWADATVCYDYKLKYDNQYDECTPEFINEHIYDKWDYNTRNKLWLPPTPISNMSDDTFFATYNYEDSEYYYYLHDNDEVIHYAKTLWEHNVNKQKYIK